MKDTHELILRDGRAIHIRKIEPADAPALQAFFRELGPFSARMFVPHQYTDEVIAARVERAVRGEDWVYVGLDGEEVVAYFFLWDVRKPFPVLGIGIADAWQDCGLGQKLMSILIDDARELGRDGISLTTMLDNDRAYHIYLKMGFVDNGYVTHHLENGELVEHSLFLPLKTGATPPAISDQNPAC